MPFSRMIRNSVIIGGIFAIVFPILFFLIGGFNFGFGNTLAFILIEGITYLGYFAFFYALNFFAPFAIFASSPILGLFMTFLHFCIFIILSYGISFACNYFRKNDEEISFLYQLIGVFIGLLVISFAIGLIDYFLLT